MTDVLADKTTYGWALGLSPVDQQQLLEKMLWESAGIGEFRTRCRYAFANPTEIQLSMGTCKRFVLLQLEDERSVQASV